MKRLSNLLAALVFASLVIFMSCGGGGDEPAPTVEELAAQDLLNKTWTVNASSITYDGSVPDGDWSEFTLSFSGGATGGSYTTANVDSSDPGFSDVWPSSGSWEFIVANDRVTGIRRTNDNVEMTGTISESSLTLTFTVPDPNTARTTGLYDAPWAFTFSIQ